MIKNSLWSKELSYSYIVSGAQGIVEADLIATLVSKLKEEVDEIKVSLAAAIIGRATY